jgi:hypothetical protein
VTPAGVAVRACRPAAARPACTPAPGTTMGGPEAPEAPVRPAAAPAEHARARAAALDQLQALGYTVTLTESAA